MSNPYTKSHQAGQHQAWLEGLTAGVELAKEKALASVEEEYSFIAGEMVAFGSVDWTDVDEALKKLEEECK